jgi:hypothetical protein
MRAKFAGDLPAFGRLGPETSEFWGTPLGLCYCSCTVIIIITLSQFLFSSLRELLVYCCGIDSVESEQVIRTFISPAVTALIS